MKQAKLELQVSNGLNISGTVQCYERKHPKEREIPHTNPQTKEEIPGVLYEIEISSIMSQILPKKSMKSFLEDRIEKTEEEKERRMKLVRGLHIEIGKKDLKPYICFPPLTEERLILAIRMWLVHQALFITEEINFGFFEGYILHKNADFEDWLQHNKYMQPVSEDKKNLLRTKKHVFEAVREIYYRKDRESYSPNEVVEAVIKVTGFTVFTEFEA